MALCVPGGDTPGEFWRSVLEKRAAFEILDPRELGDRVPGDLLAHRDYVPAGAFLSGDIGLFDPRFFGLDDRRARFMDPQQRLFLECCWEALEQAGQPGKRQNARVGVFGGTSANAYLVQNLLGNPEVAHTFTEDDLELGGNKDHATLTAAYCLGLTGPAVTVQSCCSTSLLAVHLAIQSLMSGECDVALAGAVSLRLPARVGYLWKDGSILSRQGVCRPFDARADGTVFGSGGGVVALKHYADALKDGDPIHAVILGSAVNNDGARKAGYVAPSMQGQAEVIADALDIAGVAPGDLGYIEAHGTGTAIGDAVEFRALQSVFGAAKDTEIALGTAKASVGHLDVASGVVGLINAIHVVNTGLVPGLTGFESPGTGIDLTSGPFRIRTRTTQLPVHRRIAGVSSFGVGGTNVHAVLAAVPQSVAHRTRLGQEPDARPETPFQRRRLWVAPPAQTPAPAGPTQTNARDRLIALINEVAIDPLTPADMPRDFLDLGFDSLTMSQLAGRLRRETGLELTLLDLADPGTSPAHLLQKLEQMPHATVPRTTSETPSPTDTASGPYLVPLTATRDTARSLTGEQRQFLDDLQTRYRARTDASRAMAIRARSVMADPRTISGFDLRWKDICYPIVADKSAGASFSDLDGNSYLDMVMGFGANYLGHSPTYVTEAIRAQLDRGYELGPQTTLAVEVAEHLSALTGAERVAFCNTGSEAVAAACRIARTATGRDRIVAFSGSYHGGFDAVLGRPLRDREDGTAMPIAQGIPASALADMRLFDYGSQAALDHIAAQSDDIAAVLVEPVQTRNPANIPIAFLHNLRTLCSARGVVLIFDEIVTGFRTHPGGAQALFDVPADLATYGKVIGGGLPIGAVAGKAALLDHIDGGPWQFGDTSAPGVPRTFLAGTFVRHPLAMAAARAALRHLAAGGNALPFETTHRVRRFRDRLNQHFRDRGIGAEMQSFASFATYKTQPQEMSFEILPPLLRSKGIYIGDAKLAHFSVMHSDADMEEILQAHVESLDELCRVGFF
ncbi:MAG: aminotransferase class III-fold pyridoxal phosphate-dependent enzyme [Rhodobacteraceae bacterium]|nr:aminotransferase class III-fold pyridoxal phosphate-dependent enzyme [Paracoccaceae bacterium]